MDILVCSKQVPGTTQATARMASLVIHQEKLTPVLADSLTALCPFAPSLSSQEGCPHGLL